MLNTEIHFEGKLSVNFAPGVFFFFFFFFFFFRVPEADDPGCTAAI
jgi:hypothetical protein